MRDRYRSLFVLTIICLTTISTLLSARAATTYFLAVQEGDEVLYEVTLVNSAGMAATFGVNWKTDQLDPGESSIVGAQLKERISTKTNETSYWTIEFLISTWTTGEFTLQSSSQKVYTNPSENQGSSLLMALPVIDYMKNAVFPPGAYVKDNVVTYQLSSLKIYNVTYTFSVEHGIRTKFQIFDNIGVVIYEYVLISYTPKDVIPFGDSFLIIGFFGIIALVVMTKRKINRS